MAAAAATAKTTRDSPGEWKRAAVGPQQEKAAVAADDAGRGVRDTVRGLEGRGFGGGGGQPERGARGHPAEGAGESAPSRSSGVLPAPALRGVPLGARAALGSR